MNIAEKYMTDMELNEPSNPLEINKTEDKLKIKFPEQYKKFLLSHNGAEGSIGENSYLVIWSIEDIISLNEEYGDFEFTPEILYFGSDGGDMAYAFDIERIKGVITPEDTVSRIYINFCNPWSKNASSNKHRLTYPRQLIQYRDFLKDGGEIYFKTDDDDLFRDSLTYFPASGYDIVWQTYDLHENEPEWNIRTEHEGMFTEMGIKIKALIARKKAGDDSVTWVEPKVLKKQAAQAEAEASARAEGEGNV